MWHRLVYVSGLIAASEDASAENVIAGLQAAYEDEDTAGVIVHINSPGGSPVQAGIIYDEIRRLRAENTTIPLYAVVADICAFSEDIRTPWCSALRRKTRRGEISRSTACSLIRCPHRSSISWAVKQI